jgi:hypothetical protein
MPVTTTTHVVQQTPTFYGGSEQAPVAPTLMPHQAVAANVPQPVVQYATPTSILPNTVTTYDPSTGIPYAASEV